MQHIQGISRHQLQMNSLEDKITADNPVRFIEAFVNHIDAVKLGFQSKVLKTYLKSRTDSSRTNSILINKQTFEKYFFESNLVLPRWD